MLDARTISLILAITFAPAGSTALGKTGHVWSKGRLDAACGLGAQVLQEQARMSHVVFDQTGQRKAAMPNLEYADIPADLKAAAGNGLLSNLFAECPALAQRLPEGARMATDDDREKVAAFSAAPGLYVTTIYTPLLDRTGQMALVYEFHKCAGLCGNGAVYLYRRAGGRWVKWKRPLVSIMS